MSILTRPLTYDDLLELPDDGRRREIIDGELLVSPPPRRAHQEIASDFFAELRSHVEAESLGRVYFAPVDVRLTPHDVVQPDLLFLRRDRLDLYRPEGVVEGPPDLVVEILSPSTRAVDLIRKAALYARAGVPEYWIADPDEPRLPVLTLRNGRDEDVVPEAEGRLRSVVMPGLVIDPARLFANLS